MKGKKKNQYTHYKFFYIAGFTYYEGSFVFKKLKVGTALLLVADPKNQYDDNAVEIHYKGTKIGFVPRSQNYSISKLLIAGHNVFEAVIQQQSPDENPEKQIRVGVFIPKVNQDD